MKYYQMTMITMMGVLIRKVAEVVSAIMITTMGVRVVEASSACVLLMVPLVFHPWALLPTIWTELASVCVF
jgi:hypothetical protein